MDDGGDGGRETTPSDRLRARTGGSQTKLWILIQADRRLVVAGLCLVVFVTLLVTGLVLPEAAATLRESDSVDTLFQGFLTATITGVTLVLTLNQLVLSQELGAVGDQQERMDGALSFRADVADLLGTPVSPARPAQFLRALVQQADRGARDLRDAVADDHDARGQVVDLTESLIGNAERVAADLDGARFGEFDVLSAALDFNYSWKLFAARRIRAEHDSLGDDATAALDVLVETLELFGPAREHFKTLYFQWELIDLSRGILASAVPALLVAVCMIAFFDPAGATARTLGLVPAVAVASTVSVLPFLVLLATVLRIATVTKHTLSIGPFILREAGGIEDVEWADADDA
jgi:hypothetical protein